MSKGYVTIEGRVLARAIADLLIIVERHTTYPVLSTVMLTVSESWLSVRGTDLDIDAQLDLDVTDADGGWSVCVNARVLERIARLAGRGVMHIEPIDDTDRLAVRYDATAYELDGLPADNFPEIAGSRCEAPFETFGEPGELKRLLGQVAWCVSREETRYYLNGVAWQCDGAGRRMVATDGHRLAICTYVAAEPGESLGWGVTRILPNKTVSFLRQMVRGSASVFEVRQAQGINVGAVDPYKIDIVSDNLTVRTKLVEGTFPDVDRVLPRVEGRVAAFEMRQASLMAAIGRALVFNDRHDGLGRTLKFEPIDGAICISSKRDEVGTSRINVDGLWPEGGQPFGANGTYLREVVARCKGHLIIHQNEALAPMTILDDDATMLRILMPMKV